jgi:ribosomal protein S18 acetylase RimI-like enzyme
MIIFSDRKDIDAAQLVALYRQAPWANTRSIEDAREMLTHTDVVITAWNGNRLVGLGRVLTDYVYRASIWDIIVDTTYQGQDIGTQIIQRILEHPDLKRVELFWLCTRSPGFYEKLGFSSNEQTGMVWARSKHTRQE